MEYIFHEKQEGSLCAQHCLNALLQGPYFTAVELANIAAELDALESSQLQNINSCTRISNNMNDEGCFSVQVISQALQLWSLELVPLMRQCPEAEAARKDPTTQTAFICNYQYHWFTIRRFGHQWFDLNSVLNAPRLISPTYLTIYLAQLRDEGNSIFFVTGILPHCEADQILSVCPIMNVNRDVTSTNRTNQNAPRLDSSSEDMRLALAISEADEAEEDATLKRVLETSKNDDELQRVLRISANEYDEANDEELNEAIALSLKTDLPHSQHFEKS